MLSREVSRRKRFSGDSELVIFSDGETDSTIGIPGAHVRIMSAIPEPDDRPNPDKFCFWFDQMWAYIHPDAFTAVGVSNEILTAMFPHKYVSALGTLEQMIEHYDTFGVLQRNPRATLEYADRFDHLFQGIQPNSTINWSDFFFVNSILRHTAHLRSIGVFQTFHSNVSHPSELDRTKEGRTLIKSMSTVDTVYFHTDRYARVFEDQIQRLGYRLPRNMASRPWH